jgi:hypothetical protein
MLTLSFFSISNFAKAVTLLLLSLLTLFPIASQAASMFCRSDPILFLSDGTRLQFNASIETARNNVNGIHYQVHVPIGVSIDRIVFTPNWASDIETVELINDQANGNYQLVVLVDTGNQVVAVNVTAMRVSRNNGGQGSSHQTASGVSGQAFRLQF